MEGIQLIFAYLLLCCIGSTLGAECKRGGHKVKIARNLATCPVKLIDDIKKTLPKPGRKRRATTKDFQTKSCDQLTAEYEKAPDTKFSCLNPTDTSSVVGVLYREATVGGKKATYPLAIQAEVNNRHLSCARRDFKGTKWASQMSFMEAIKGDERGHLVAAQLCGPVEWYNLAPQTAAVNRNLGNAGNSDGWIIMENAIAKYLKGTCGHVDFTVVLNYDAPSRRPKGYKVCANFRDGDFKDVLPSINFYYENV